MRLQDGHILPFRLCYDENFITAIAAVTAELGTNEDNFSAIELVSCNTGQT